MEQNLITSRQVAEILGCTTPTVRKLAKRGKLSYCWGPNPSPHGHREILLYPLGSVQQLLEEITPPPGLLAHDQVADILGINHYTVFRWGNQGRFPYVEIPTLARGKSSTRMYPSDAIEKLADKLWGAIIVPDDWGYWFSGLVDGEGSFIINCRQSGKIDTPVFRVTLRDDDGYILYDIRNVLRIGSTTANKGRIIHSNGKAYRGKPTLSFHTTNLHEAYKLTTVLDRYPLRTRKLLCYNIWKEAVMEFRIPYRQRDWDRLKQLIQQCQEVKKYIHPDPDYLL